MNNIELQGLSLIDFYVHVYEQNKDKFQSEYLNKNYYPIDSLEEKTKRMAEDIAQDWMCLSGVFNVNGKTFNGEEIVVVEHEEDIDKEYRNRSYHMAIFKIGERHFRVKVSFTSWEGFDFEDVTLKEVELFEKVVTSWKLKK